jgi:hypothetical protein
MIFLFVVTGIIIVFLVIKSLSKKSRVIDPSTAADVIERFIEGKSSDWEWDDFISSPIGNPILEKIRARCLQLDKEFPPTNSGQYTNDKGLEILRSYVEQLRRK